MDQLPLEILQLIFSSLNPTDIPLYRFVGRRFASVGLHYLDVKKNFYFREHSLKRLENLANHPVLSSRMFDMVFFVDILPIFNTKKEWLEQARGVCDTLPTEDDQICFAWLQRYNFYEAVPMDRPEIPAIFLASAWNDHQAIQKEQERLLSDLENTVAKIRLNLSKTLNLKSFSCETFGRYHRESMRQLYTLQPAEQAWYCCNYTCSLPSFEIICPAILSPFIDDKSTPTVFSLQSLDISATDFADFNGLNPKVSSKSSLQHIQSISLASTSLESRLGHIVYSGLFRSPYNNNDNGLFFQNVFVNAPNLVAIMLNVKAEPQLITKTIFHGCVWNNLQRLDLIRVDIDKATFELFLSRHAETLHTLRLYSADMQSDLHYQAIWIDFLTFIQRTMNLKDFMLGGYLSENELVEFDINRTCTSNPESKNVPIHRMIRYLVCRKACDRHGRRDNHVQTLLEWHTLSWADVQGAYV